MVDYRPISHYKQHILNYSTHCSNILAMMGRVECMKVLIKLGSDINHANQTGSTPLHAASLNGYGECMELLVEKGMLLQPGLLRNDVP